jgi:hypothetical protein
VRLRRPPQTAGLPTRPRSSRSERTVATVAAIAARLRLRRLICLRLRPRHVGVGNLLSNEGEEARQRQHGEGEGELPPIEIAVAGGGQDGGGGGLGGPLRRGREDADLVEDVLLQSTRRRLKDERP